MKPETAFSSTSLTIALTDLRSDFQLKLMHVYTMV